MAVATKEFNVQNAHKHIESEVPSGTKTVPNIERAPTRDLERTQFGGISKMEAMGLRDGAKLIRFGPDEEVEKFARITVIPEHQSMLVQRAEKMKVSTLHAMLAANPALKEEFHERVRGPLISAIDSGLLSGEAIIVLSKAPPEAKVAVDVKAHIARRKDTPITAFRSLIDVKVTPNADIREDAIRTLIEIDDAESQKVFVRKERTRELRALVPRFTNNEKVKEAIASPETEEWLQLEMIYANAYLSPAIEAKLKILNRPEINRALERRGLSLPISLMKPLRALRKR